MNLEITTRPAFSVAGMHLRTDVHSGKLPGLWQDFLKQMESMPAVDRRAYGVCDNFDPKTRQFDYLAAVEVAPGMTLPGGMKRWDIPEQTYAVFPCTLATIKQAYDSAYHTWLPASAEWAPSDGPTFELMDERFCGGAGELYLHVAVVPKSK